MMLKTMLWFLVAGNLALGAEKTDISLDDYVPYLAASRASRNAKGANKALFYDFFPSNLERERPSVLEIRSLFSGSLQVIESAQFGISVNISGKSTFDLANVEVEYTAVDDTILLQLKDVAPATHGGLSSLVTLAIVAGAVMAVVLIVASAYICFWLVKFEEGNIECSSPALSTPTLDTFGSLSYVDIDTNSLVKSWQDEEFDEDDGNIKDTPDPSSITEDVGSVAKTPQMGNGDINRSLQLTSQRADSSSDNNSKPHYNNRRQRYRAATQRSRDISSSDDLSSIDDNWTKRKASWKKGNAQETILEKSEYSDSNVSTSSQHTVAHVVFQSAASTKRAQFSDNHILSGDAGFCSSGEHRPHRRRSNRGGNHSMDELEWDEYDPGDGTLPPPSAVVNGWQLSTDEEKPQDHLWPPPLNEPLHFSDESDREGDVNLEDVREAIHNAMDSVNSDINANRDAAANKLESPHDDGYETGVAVNGSTTAGAVGPPPVDPKPSSNSRGSKPGHNKLSTTAMVSVAFLGLVTGTYGFVSNLTVASIVVYIPNNFFDEVNFFINETDRIDFDISRKPENTKVHMFEISNPILTDFNKNRCDGSKKCEQGCNRKTGICACTQGYVLFEEIKCTDKSDCLYMPCTSTEICSDTIGGYTCNCAPDYWRDQTGSCVLCSETKCPPGTYEAAGCPDRVCLPCSNGCADGQYITDVCKAKVDTQCSDCTPPCLEDEYEYKPCTNLTNRKCNKIRELPAAKGSGNLILESISNRRLAKSNTWLMGTPHKGQQFTMSLIRGSGISIKVSVKEVNLYPSMQSVDHPESNDNEEFASNDGPPSILTSYCRSPIPINYELLPVQHENVTAAKRVNCPDCMVDPRQPCRTYKTFGRTAPLDPFDKSMVCSTPNTLAEMFNLNSYLSESGSIVVQPTEACQAIKSSCDSCSQTCANDILGERNTNCSVTAEDDAHSWSPRLMYCQNCCLNKNCRDRCTALQQCHPVSCWNGNVAEFFLSAKFPTRTMEFYCDVALNKTMPLISLVYTVMYNDTALKNYSITIMQNDSTVTQESYSDGLLTIDYSTGVADIPDIIHGELNIENLLQNFSAGSYTPVGNAAHKVDVSRVDIIPVRPFAFSTKWWKMQNCSETIVDRFLLSNGDPIMETFAEINVSKADDYTYTLWNKSRQPSVKFRVPVDVSVIEKLYPPTTVDVSSLNARVSRFVGGWRVVVDGKIGGCPGHFMLKVWELNKCSPLAEYEVAVHKKEGRGCHREFSVVLDIAGGDVSKIERRQFRVEVVDKGGRRHFIQAESEPPVAEERNLPSPSKIKEEPALPKRTVVLIMGPFLLIIGVTVIVLSIAWIVSVVIPRRRGPVVSTPQCRAAMFVFYTLLRVVYIFGTSLSIFALIWYAMNINDLIIVQNYMDVVDTVISQQQYDLRTLVDFSTQTVTRQQEDFKHMRAKCFTNIENLQNQSQTMIQEFSKDMTDELSSLPVRNELITSLDDRARDLQVQLETLRLNYNNYAQITSQKLALEIGKTLEDFEKTAWLSAARTIRGSVITRSLPTSNAANGFQKWLGIRTQLHSVQTNFLMDPLPISGINDLVLPHVPAAPVYKPVDLETVFMPTHNLYSEMKAPQISRADAMHRLYGMSLTSRMSMITVLAVLLLLDLLMLTSRIAETLDTGQLILDGYLIKKTYRETYQDGCSSKKYITDKLTKRPQRVRYRLYKLILETNCVPLLVALGVILAITFICLVVGLDLVSVETLTNVGLFSSLMGPWHLTSNIALDNIQMNTERINTVDIPSTEATLNHYIERVETLNNIYNNLSYYRWQIECGDSPSSWCGEFNQSRLMQELNVKDMNCSLQPIALMGPSDMPHTLTDMKVQELIEPYITAFSCILESSASLLLTYTSYMLIVNMISAVMWNFLTRTGHVPGVRVVITNQLETEEKPAVSEAEDVPTHMMFNRSTIEEEDSLEYEDGGLSDEPHENGCPLSEEIIANGGHATS